MPVIRSIPNSDLHVSVFGPQRLGDLRSRAASRLTGSAATKGSSARAADALTVLHGLASSPATASDALTLLHELQVHQVELDLQSQEMHDARAELEAALGRQTELYDHQPVGCFTIDARFILHELNQTGADMLGVAREDAFGLPLDAFLGADSAPRFKSALSAVDASARRTPCLLTLCPRTGPPRSVLVSVGVDPAANRYFVNFTEVADAFNRTPDGR